MTDKRIAALMLTSPETGLQEAVLQYSAYVLKICRIKLSGICSEEDIEEAVSDVFFKFYTYCKSSSRKLKTARGLISVIAARHWRRGRIPIFSRCCRRLRAKPREV